MPRRSGCCRYPTRPTLRIEVADPQHSLVLYGSPADMGAEDSWERSIWQFVVPPEARWWEPAAAPAPLRLWPGLDEPTRFQTLPA
jgi:hypothetical protein